MGEWIFKRTAVAATFGLLLLALGVLLPASGSAAGTCDLVAATDGTDKAAGTDSAPLQTAQALADRLGPGQTGCLRGAGDVFDDDLRIKVTSPGITLTSYPGTRATLKGRLWITADGVTVDGLNLDGSNGDIGPRSPTITAADVTFRNNDVTNNHGATSCFGLGSSYGRAVRTVIENNRIHDCGRIPSTNFDHGIYIESSTDAVIRNNLIYDNVDRGIQLYPDAQGTKITGNVIDGNGEGIIFSGKDSLVSNNTTVSGNIIANSRIRWNVESGGNGPTAVGNLVRTNCVWASSSSSYYNKNYGVQPNSKNFQASSNVGSKPVYVDRSAGDLSLTANSGCRNVFGGTTTQTPTETVTTTTSAPAVKLKGKSRKVVLNLRAGSEEVTAVATGKMRVHKRACHLNRVQRSVRSGHRTAIVLRARRHRCFTQIRRAMRRGAKARAAIAARVTDDLGHQIVKRRVVRLG